MAKFALLNSPVQDGETKRILEECLNAIKNQLESSKDIDISLHFFEFQQPHGCIGHPSVDDHESLADSLLPFYTGLLK